MSQSVKLSDGSYIDASAVYDSNKSKTQQQFNTEITNAVNSKIVRGASFSYGAFGCDVPSNRYFDITLDVASEGRTGVKANYSNIHFTVYSDGIDLTGYNVNTSSWERIWRISKGLERKVISFSGKAITTKSAAGNYYGTLGALSDYGLTEDQILSVSIGSWSSLAGCVTPYIQNGYFRLMSNVSIATANVDLIVAYLS